MMTTPGEGAFCACGAVFHLTRRGTVECGLCGRRPPELEIVAIHPDTSKVAVSLSDLARMLAPLLERLKESLRAAS